MPDQLNSDRKNEILDYIMMAERVSEWINLKFVDHFEKELSKEIPSYTSNLDLKMMIKVLREYVEFLRYSRRIEFEEYSKSSNAKVRQAVRFFIIADGRMVIKEFGQKRAKAFFDLNR